MTAAGMSAKVSESPNPIEIPPDYLDGEWSIRQCFLYKEEYDDCKSYKARFHQYFIHGDYTDCSQWKTDYDNCRKFRESKDVNAGKTLVASEAARRHERLKAHYANDVWKKRRNPPDDWNKPLPEWLQKKNENSYLEVKAKEMETGISSETESKSSCSIM